MDVQLKARANGCLTVCISGRLDYAADAVETALMAHMQDSRTKGIVLDLSGCDYVSSVGLRVLMVLEKAARQNQKELVIAGLQPVVAEIFAISHHDRVHKILPSREEAEAAIDASLGK